MTSWLEYKGVKDFFGKAYLCERYRRTLESVVSVVRNLSLPFLLRNDGSRTEPELETVTLAVALALAEARKERNQRVTMLSRVAIPFWIVQTSETKSIILSAAAGSRQEFKFTDTKAATEIRKIVTSGVPQPEDVPAAVKRIEALLDKTDTITALLANLFPPASIVSAGSFITEADPSIKLNRLDMKANSSDALKRTEEFREVQKGAKLRVEAIESIKEAMTEKLGEHRRIVENLIAVERERWNLRIKTMEERTKQEISDAAKNRNKQNYDLREKTKMDLRAMTADFSRSANELEIFFNEALDSIRTARTRIGQQEDDIEGAVSIYKELAKTLTSRIQQINQPLKIMDEKSEKMLKSLHDITRESDTKKTSYEATYELQVKERNQKIDDTKKEMENKRQELNELYMRIKESCEICEQLVEERINTLQREYLDLMAWTLENDSIKGLMPLTLLDVEVFIAKYDGGSTQILTPCLTPDTEISLTARGKPISQELDKALIQSLNQWIRLDPTMKNAFVKSLQAGNVLLETKATQLLSEGLDTLVKRRLLDSTDKERFIALWSRYSSKCPKCGTATEEGAKFCQKCGQAFN